VIVCSTGAPVPVSDAVCGLVTALSDTLNWPIRLPPAVGENVTLTEQDAPAASVAGEMGQLLVCLKSPLTWNDVMDRGTGWWFVTWTVLLPLVAPIFVEPKVKELGDNVTGAIPLPLKPAVVGDP
jgi:hypothetical protein